MSVEKDVKMGLTGGSGSGGKWNLRNPSSYKPESAPAKPKGGATAGAAANKHATTHSSDYGIPGKMKSRY